MPPTTGEITTAAGIDEWDRAQTWTDPATQTVPPWTERGLVVRAGTYQAGLRRRRERALARVTDELAAVWQPAGRGRKRYRSRATLERTVAERVARAGLPGVVQAAGTEETVPDGTTRWMVAAIWVELSAWHALGERLGWQVDVTNTTSAQYTAPALVVAYHHHVIHERGFSRLKTRNLQIRPVFLRDEPRIVGLLWLWCLAVRVLTLTEHRLRTALADRHEELVGLNPASRTETTSRPTTERVIAAFSSMTLTMIRTGGERDHHVTPLNTTQRHLLALLQLPADLYERLAQRSSNLVLHLRE